MSHKNLSIVSVCVAVLGFGTAGFFYFQYQKAQSKLANPSEANAREVSTLVSKVGKLMMLPTGEEPTVATVTNTEKLKVQPFFANSENGDKVLIYTQARKAILYREQINKIIDVAPVNIGSDATVSAQIQTEKPVRFVVYNGTNTVGLTKKYETELIGNVQGAVVVDRDNAKKNDYAQSFLIDLSGANSVQASGFAATLGLELSDLPEGETKPTGADFLIILGADKK